MIDTVLNLLFRCSHRRLSRPLTPARRMGAPRGETYVVCLDCGKRFTYDVKSMRIGRPLESPRETGASAPESFAPRRKKLGYLMASLPAALFLGAVVRRRRGHRLDPPAPKPPG